MKPTRGSVGAARLQRRDSLEADLERVALARVGNLRDLWRERFDEEPPVIRGREVLRRMLAYRLQEAVHGGLGAVSRRKLAELEQRRVSPPTKPAVPKVRIGEGATLLREWKGVRYAVRVVPGGFFHEGLTYKSLSEVARAITGTRWNGPLFFGLREKIKEAA